MEESVTILTIKAHTEGDLKGYYTAHMFGKEEPIMKSKTKSRLVRSIYKYYLGQGE